LTIGSSYLPWVGLPSVQSARLHAVSPLQIDSDKLSEDQLAIIPVGTGCKPGFVVFKVG
jgi:hypothetical protein